MDKKVLEVALQAYMDGWCKSVEGTERCIATWDDETDVAHARAGVRAALLASLPVLLGEPVACNVIDPYGALVAERVTTEHADEIIGRHEWSNCHKGDFLYAPSLGEGDGR